MAAVTDVDAVVASRSWWMTEKTLRVCVCVCVQAHEEILKYSRYVEFPQKGFLASLAWGQKTSQDLGADWSRINR